MERLQRRLDELSSQLLAAREGHATATLETALLGDRRDELAEALQLATAKAAEDARLLAEERGARRRAEAAVQPNPNPNPNPNPDPEPEPYPDPITLTLTLTRSAPPRARAEWCTGAVHATLAAAAL